MKAKPAELVYLDELTQAEFIEWAKVDVLGRNTFIEKHSGPPMNAVMYYTLMLDTYRHDYKSNLREMK